MKIFDMINRIVMLPSKDTPGRPIHGFGIDTIVAYGLDGQASGEGDAQSDAELLFGGLFPVSICRQLMLTSHWGGKESE